MRVYHTTTNHTLGLYIHRDPEPNERHGRQLFRIFVDATTEPTSYPALCIGRGGRRGVRIPLPRVRWGPGPIRSRAFRVTEGAWWAFRRLAERVAKRARRAS